MVDADGDWKWELLRHRLPTPVLLRIAAIQRPKPSFPMDSIGWKLGDDKKFSICTAYHVRSDALRMLQQRSSEVCPYIIGSHIHQLCREDWRVVFSKVARCNNGVADGLAKLASDSSFDVVFFDEPPGGIETG
ncbi:hypothetical protein V6N11_074225 [Hibiscus sabdariffa]|uniref:RNase H type-1 domain-containing protein n=1 Tax=Hibiscus sabdariffa TaxID=183260 RepID=A0ABR2NK25_9ROSI